MKCFIEFDITENTNFDDLRLAFDAFKMAKNMEEPQSDSFWISIFPDYALEHFSFLKSDIQPNFKTANIDNPFIWHFYSLTELLSVNYEIEYLDCFKLSDHKGRLEYYPYSYPYGGITGLVVFLKAFNCIPTFIDDGTSLYAIIFLSTGDFSITDLNDAGRQNSAKKLFNGTKLLGQFTRRFNKS